jgi:hypothetical protein
MVQKFNETDEALPPRSSGCGSFLYGAMSKFVRVLGLAVLPLLVVLVTPSAFAQSWISAVTATTTTTTATINWTTAVPANSQVTYGTTTSYGTGNVLNPNFTTAHSASLTALTAGTSYHYRVLSADSTGALVTGLDNVFTTPAAAITVSISPSTATVASGGTQQFSAQVTNTSNTAVTWSATAGTVSTTGLLTAPTVTANTTVTVKATLVADTTKYASATVTVTASAFGKLTLSPTSIAFGSITVGQTSPVLITTLTNTGNASLTITSDSLSAGDFNWGGQGTCNYNTLAPGSSCTYSAKFTPTATGTRTATITIYSTASDSTVTLPLSGTGTTATTGTLAASPTAMGLGSVVVGTSGTASGSLTASGASVTVNAVSSNNSAFSVGGLSLPITIPAGQKAAFTVTFTPQTTGAATAAFTFTSNAQSSTTVETLTGTGMSTPVHTVHLSWNASTSSGVAGYNVYRAPYTSSCGAYAKVNSVPNTGTLYTDAVVADGTNYCYATTAVDSSNRESGDSNIVLNVQIPMN